MEAHVFDVPLRAQDVFANDDLVSHHSVLSFISLVLLSLDLKLYISSLLRYGEQCLQTGNVTNSREHTAHLIAIWAGNCNTSNPAASADDSTADVAESQRSSRIFFLCLWRFKAVCQRSCCPRAAGVESPGIGSIHQGCTRDGIACSGSEGRWCYPACVRLLHYLF